MTDPSTSGNKAGSATAEKRKRMRLRTKILLGVAGIIVALVATLGIRFYLEFNDPAIAISTGNPATAPLAIPPLLEPTIVDGVGTFELELAPSSHTYKDGVAVDTLSYNNSSVLGPTLLWRTGQSLSLDVTNGLEDPTTTHWHGADVPAEADGGPASRIEPGDTWNASFDVIQPAATLWYHPHLMGSTAEQVFDGAAGLIIIEEEPRQGSPVLPDTYGVDDIPVILQDREFDGSGQLKYELNDNRLGDRNPELSVNGTMDPYLDVPAGPVRLRLLNASQARIYTLSVDNSTFIKIASDGGYLNRPVALTELTMGPGDRAEIVVDMTNGTVNLLDDAFERVLELRPDDSLEIASPVPGILTNIEPFDLSAIDNERDFHMDAVGSGWGINGKQMDPTRIDETIRFGDTEKWNITVGRGTHVFHVHQTQFQIIEINGEPPPPEEAGWEDTVLVTNDREVVVIARFDTFTNPDVPYMFHCHILDHEDTGMMGQFQILDE